MVESIMLKKKTYLLSWLIISILSIHTSQAQVYLPIHAPDRQSMTLQLTEIGEFGIWRKKRPQFTGHLHTGIDIRRPVKNYNEEPVFPITSGRVISKRTDGPFAQLIIEHHMSGLTFWTLYEHISDIVVNLGDEVNPHEPIARFMNRSELDKYGWQFDHFHFEILKQPPINIKPDSSRPERRFGSFTLTCFTQDQLEQRFYDPLTFLERYF